MEPSAESQGSGINGWSERGRPTGGSKGGSQAGSHARRAIVGNHGGNQGGNLGRTHIGHRGEPGGTRSGDQDEGSGGGIRRGDQERGPGGGSRATSQGVTIRGWTHGKTQRGEEPRGREPREGPREETQAGTQDGPGADRGGGTIRGTQGVNQRGTWILWAVAIFARPYSSTPRCALPGRGGNDAGVGNKCKSVTDTV